jgi:hypothetical protein
MSDHAATTAHPTDLRMRAATRLTGSTRAKGPAAGATDALAVLHTLASSPATAADALALLHELQVHQVELDLQAEELRESRAELESALRRQIELYDFQPVACFTVDRHLHVIESNRVGAGMLGVESDGACGLGLDAFVSAGSLRTLQDMVSRVVEGGQDASGVLEWRSKGGLEQPVHAALGPDPAGSGCFVVLTRTGTTTGAELERGQSKS